MLNRFLQLKQCKFTFPRRTKFQDEIKPYWFVKTDNIKKNIQKFKKESLTAKNILFQFEENV